MQDQDSVFTSEKNTISVVTATLNADRYLPRLITSLQDQIDKDFEWIVADGCSDDDTCLLIQAISDINVVLSSQQDFGIYDALNRGIKLSTGRYYLVIGADDYLFPDAVENFRKAISGDADIVSANIRAGDRLVKPGRGKSWLYGQYEFVSGHAVGTLFKKSLHDRYGYYSHNFPIAADQLFIKQCAQSGVSIVFSDFVAGRFGLDGISAEDSLGTLSESFRVQMITERYKYLQVIIFIARLIKNIKKL